MRLHYFNPGHETAVLAGSPAYTSTAAVRLMQRDLAFLPAWYAEEGDYIYMDEALPTAFIEGLSPNARPPVHPITREGLARGKAALPALRVDPWGLSPQALGLFRRLAQRTGASLLLPEWKEAFVRLTSRRAGVDCFRRVQTLLPDLPFPPAPRFCERLPEVVDFMEAHEPPFVLKTPFSSSGRGLLWIEGKGLSRMETNWIEGAIRRQGGVCVERGLRKVVDFALEYVRDGRGEARYAGLSVFHTDRRGTYTGNRLEAPDSLRAALTRYVDPVTLRRIQAAVGRALGETYAPYAGYIGVDMLVYERADGSFDVHPCVEVNMRRTMGMVAWRLFQRYLAPKAKGLFRIECERMPGVAWRKHRADGERFPIRRADGGLIRSGYLPLCPVGMDTRYRAYALLA